MIDLALLLCRRSSQQLCDQSQHNHVVSSCAYTGVALRKVALTAVSLRIVHRGDERLQDGEAFVHRFRGTYSGGISLFRPILGLLCSCSFLCEIVLCQTLGCKH